MQAEKHDFTLILATLNRHEKLKRAIKSILEQEGVSFQLIVIDQGGDQAFSENAEFLNSLEVGNSNSITHIRFEGHGLSRARNVGLAEKLTGKYICFPDDDCWYANKLLLDVSSFFKANRQVDLLIGQYLEPGMNHNPRFPAMRKRLYARGAAVSSVGMFFRSDVFTVDKIRFIESIGAGTQMPVAEEYEVFLQALKLGKYAFFDPDIKVFHAVGRNRPTDSSRIRNEEAARGYVHAKHFFSHGPIFTLWLSAKILKLYFLFLLKRDPAADRFPGYLKGIRAYKSHLALSE